ncbi:MAG: hypothetical protein DRJ96_06770 [Thermoprotei archaeon]|nr:MAG: hypothetical protein DRJ67_04995 [Thermoprotei archaeon]RLE96375.1 MAG: hypothetical protein DRJ96_06770 [Thermoprotei archaeon]
MTLVEEVVKHALKLGADEAHAVLTRSRDFTVEIEVDEISRVSFIVRERLSVAVIKERRIAAASISEVSREAALKCVERAYRMALALKPNEHWGGLPEPKPLPRVPGLYDPKVAELTAEEIVERGKLLLEAAHEVSDKVAVMNASVTCSTSEVEAASSAGLHAFERHTGFWAMAVTVAREAGQVGSFAYEADASRSLDVDVEAVAREAARKALESLHLKPVPSFKGTLVMDYDFAAMLLSSLAAAYSGYNVWRGSSPLASKLGEAIASERLTIIDDGTLPGGLRSSSFDGEGSPTMRKVVVERGVLRTYLNNTFTARLLGMEPTGNAADLISVAPSNTIVEPGDMSVEELVSGVKRGLLVSRFSGMIRFQDGVVSGTAKQAFYIEGGEKKYPVRECMVSCNLYELLKNISGLSREVRRTPYGVITPVIRAEGVAFVAKS